MVPAKTKRQMLKFKDFAGWKEAMRPEGSTDEPFKGWFYEAHGKKPPGRPRVVPQEDDAPAAPDAG